MDIPTPEQLKQEKAERDSVLAELLLSERKNKDLTAENNRLEKSIEKLTSIEGDLKIKIEQRTKLLSDIVQIKKNIAALSGQESALRDSILRAENDIGLQTWVGQRDKLLKIVGDLKTSQDSLEKKNTELSEANADLETRISKHLGRLEELERAEKTKGESVSTEVAELIARKGKLEGEVEVKEAEVVSLDAKKATLLESIEILTEVHDKVFSNVNQMEGIVGSVKEVSDKNVAELRELFAEMGSKVREVIEKGKESADGANVILEKLPKWIFELQRPVSIKRIRPERLMPKTLPAHQNKKEE